MVNFIIRLFRKLFRIIQFIVSIPISFFLILIFPFLKIKLVPLVSDRIGHYALNTELLLCYLNELKKNGDKSSYFFYLRDAPLCNEQLHLMWKRTICIFSKKLSVIIYFVDQSLKKIMRKYYKNAEFLYRESIANSKDLDDYLFTQKPKLIFNGFENEEGEKLKEKIGIPKDAKYICLLARDSAYLDHYFKNTNWSYHFYRDSSIENYESASLYLASLGYFVIRMGKSVSKKMSINHPNIIDYASSELRSDFMDIYLSAHCHFFISTCSGLDSVAQIFRRPLLFVNVAPFKKQLQWWYPCELFLLKKVIDLKSGRCIEQNQIDTVITAACDVKKVIDTQNWIVAENSPEEILTAVIEMEQIMSKSSSNIGRSLKDKLNQEDLLCYFPERDFLKKNSHRCYIRMCSILS